MKTAPAVLACMALATLVGACRPAPPPVAPQWTDPSALAGAAALAEAHALVALGPRDSGTPGAERAAAHLAARLVGAGLAVTVDAFTNDTPRGAVVFRNVTSLLPATARARNAAPRLIVLLSHYDTRSGIATNFCGANDSGSSTGLLLALARVLAATPERPCDILFAFLDGEECMQAYGPNDGLHGSRRLARTMAESGQARRVRGVILLDMIGDRDLTVTIPRNASPALVTAVFTAAEQVGTRRHFSLLDAWMTDDHVPFIEAGMPAIDLIDFQYGSQPRANDYWHTTADTMDKLGAGSLEAVGRTVLAALPLVAGGP